MAEWFFRKKSKGEVERDPGVSIVLSTFDDLAMEI